MHDPLAHIPPAIAQGIKDYIEEGYEPGGFLLACLENDFLAAALRADEISKRYLKEIALAIMELPEACRGSKIKVAHWLKVVMPERIEAQTKAAQRVLEESAKVASQHIAR